jgi:hypothetical protein
LQKCSDIRVDWWGVDYRSQFREHFRLLSSLDLAFQKEDVIFGGFGCKVEALVTLMIALNTA